MKMTKKDLFFLLPFMAVLVLLFLKSGSETAAPVPTDREHQGLIDRLVAGEERETVESVCPECHNAAVRPLPQEHPPKEQCLICHQRQ